MAYRLALFLNDLQDKAPVAGFIKCDFYAVVQQFTRFYLTSCLVPLQ